MINGKQFKRIFGIILFVLFGFGFNSNYTNGIAFNVNTEYDLGYLDIDVNFQFDNSVNYLYNNPITFAGSKCNASTIFWNDGKLGFITQRGFNTSNCNQEAGEVKQGYFTKICKLPYTDSQGCINDGRLDYGGCNLATKCSGKWVDIQDFYDYTGSINTISFYSGYYNSYNRTFCFNYIDDNTSFCVFTNLRKSDGRPTEYSGYDFTTVINYNSLLTYESPTPYSPFTVLDNSSSTIVYTNSDLDKVISYYETRYNRNESMCYVGTFNTTGNYGEQGIDFVSGTGNSVFGLYYVLYNSYGNNIIKNIGSWINVRLINYSERFYNNDNIRYLASYNGPDSNISLYYTGFSFPFANKPVALYFMASNLYDGYSRESTQGEEMSYYCYSKLNYQQIKDGNINFDTVKEMVSTGINERLDTYYNYHIVNNSGSYITPSSGSFWDAFGTGYEDSDLDLDTTFSDFFDKITSVFQNYSPDYSTGIIPDWILYPLIFLILFRIMKH